MNSFWSSVVSGLMVVIIKDIIDKTKETIKKKVSLKHGKHIKKP